MLEIFYGLLCGALGTAYVIELWRLKRKFKDLDFLIYQRAIELLRRSEARVHRESDTHDQSEGQSSLSIAVTFPAYTLRTTRIGQVLERLVSLLPRRASVKVQSDGISQCLCPKGKFHGTHHPQANEPLMCTFRTRVPLDQGLDASPSDRV